MKRYIYLLCAISVIFGCGRKQTLEPINVSLEDLHQQARAFFDTKDYDSMTVVANQMIVFLQGDTLSPYYGHALIHKGNVHELQGKYDSATYYYYDALRISELIDHKLLIGRALNNLGILYFNLGQTEEAVAHYQHGLSIAREMGDSVLVCKALNNIGNAYATIDRDFDKSIPYFEACIQLAKEIGDDEAYTSAKLTLIQIWLEQGIYEEVFQAVQEIRSRGVNHYYVDYTEADAYMKTQKYDKAIELFEKILPMKVNSPELIQAVLTNLSLIYKEKKDFQTALDYKDKSYAHRDSIHNIETRGIIEGLKVSYETEKKETAIVSLKKEKQLYFWLGATGITMSILVLLILLFRQRIIHHKKELAEQRISELEKEKQLVAAESLLNGENHERGRLSKELHDGLGGLLTMAKLDLSQLKERMTNETDCVEHVITLMNQSIFEMRRMAHNLMPESLARFGLRPVLEEFCSNSTKINFHFFGTEKRLNEKEEINLYRIASELINNALKHADASEISVQLLFSEEYISLTVQDNGIGFKITDIREGLTTVRSRSELLGATVQIYSEPGKGTEITIEYKINSL